MLEIALIADIHSGPDRGTKLGTEAARLFKDFADWVRASSCQLVIDLGDRISDVDRKTDARLATEVGSWFQQQISHPHFHLPGNHDLAELTLEENEEMLDCNLQSQSMDLNGFHLVLWNSEPKMDKETGFSLDESRLDWLRTDLAGTKLPTIVFSHLPLDNGSMKGNFYFDKAYPRHAYYSQQDGERIREVLERSERVKLCVNGHAHWNAYHCIDGIHYVTIPSLTELFPTYPQPSKSWAKLSVDKEIHLQVFGNLPIEYRLPICPDRTEHWLNMDKEYAPQVAEPK